MKLLDNKFLSSILFIVIINFLKFDLCKCEAKEDFIDSSVTSVECGGKFSGHQYLIKSPNYPNNYGKNLNCVYDLIGVNDEVEKCSSDREFHLQFLKFEIEESNNCTRDYFRIGNGEFYCGNIIGIRKFKSDNNNSLKIVFHSDGNEVTGKGFEILVSTIPCNDNDRTNQSIKIITEEENFAAAGNLKSVNNESKIIYPIYYNPQVEFDDEKNGRRRIADRPDDISDLKNLQKVFSKLPEGLKRPAEKLELPIFGVNNFNDKNRQPESPPKITSYLYLPSKFDSENFKASLSTKNSSYEDDEKSAINRFIVGQSSSSSLHRQNAESSKFQHPKEVQKISNVGWLTYGTPDSLAPIPLAPASLVPIIPNCDKGNFENKNINYRRIQSSSNFGNDKENLPIYFNRSPIDKSVENSDNYYGYGNTELIFEDNDPSFEVNNNNNNNNGDEINIFKKNRQNYLANYYYPNYGIDQSTTFDIFGDIDTDLGTTRQECCNDYSIYSSDNFLITNPGFPTLLKQSSKNYECGYTIKKSSQNICRLNLNFKFFNFGSDDRFCAYGYLEIDGERYCGCKTGLNITTNFDDISTKRISVKYSGYPKGKFDGFLIDVKQEYCSTNYYHYYLPSLGENYFFRRRQRRNLINGEEENEKEEEKEKEEEEEKEENFRKFFRPKRDAGYYYRAPSTPNENYSTILDGTTCRIFKFFNWVKAAKQVWLKNAQCTASSSLSGSSLNGQIINSASSDDFQNKISIIPIFPKNSDYLLFNNPSNNRNCVFVNVVEGTISSLYYPNNYPNDTSQCFRFAKAPGYCQLELAILDFDLENSAFCRKDYVSFAGLKRRYCGNSLAGSRTIFDFARSSYAEIYFSTDSSGNGRGFRAGFSQISC